MRRGRGPAPKPTNLRLVDSKHPAPVKKEPKAPAATKFDQRPPSWMKDKEAIAEWERVLPLLLKMRLFTAVDRSTFAAYCSAWARFLKAEKALADGVLTQTSGHGTAIRSEVNIARDAMREVRAFMAEFGLSPAARTRLAMGKEPSEEEFEDAVSEERKRRSSEVV